MTRYRNMAIFMLQTHLTYVHISLQNKNFSYNNSSSMKLSNWDPTWLRWEEKKKTLTVSLVVFVVGISSSLSGDISECVHTKTANNEHHQKISFIVSAESEYDQSCTEKTQRWRHDMHVYAISKHWNNNTTIIISHFLNFYCFLETLVHL